MKRSEAEAILDRLTYKPGHHFVLLDRWRNRDYAVGLWQTGIPDANGSEKFLDLRFTGKPFSPEELDAMTEEDLLRAARETAMFLERHEMSEWLRYDGKRFQDPHDQKGEKMEEYALGGLLFDPALADGQP